MKQILTKPIGRIVLAAMAVLALIAYVAICVVETVETDVWSDQYVKTYRRSTLWCYWSRGIAVHASSCERYCIRIGSEEWDNFLCGPNGYWRDPADGAILFSTYQLGSGVADVYLVMPSGRPQFRDRVRDSELVNFSGGDTGSEYSKVLVTRLGKQKFELKSRDNPLDSMVIDLPLYKK